MAASSDNRETTFAVTGQDTGLGQMFNNLVGTMEKATATANTLAAALSRVAEAQAKMDKKRSTYVGGSATVTGADGSSIHVDVESVGTATQSAKAFSAAINGIDPAARSASKSLKELNDTVDKAPSFMDKLAGSITEALSGIKNFAAGIVIYKAMELLTNKVRELTQAYEDNINAAARMQRYQSTFTGLLGSSGQQDLSQLVGFAAKTPFSLEDSIQLSQRLIATGMQWKDVIPTMGAAANAIARVGGSSESLQGLIKALTDIQARGKLSAQEINQMANAGVSALEVLRTATGKSNAELVKMVENGQVSSGLFLASLRNASIEWGDFMGKQSQDLMGITQNLEDVHFQLDQTFGKPAMDARIEASRKLLEIYSSPGAHRAAEMGGGIFGIFGGLGPGMEATTAQNQIAASYLVDQLNNFLRTKPLQDYVTWNVEIAKQLANVGYTAKTAKENLDEYNNSVAANYKDQIDSLQKINDQLSRQQQIRDALNQVSSAEARYAKEAALALDVGSAAGMQAYLGIDETRSSMVSARQNRDTLLAHLRTQDKIDELTDKMNNQASNTAPFSAPPTAYGPGSLPGWGGYVPSYGMGHNMFPYGANMADISRQLASGPFGAQGAYNPFMYKGAAFPALIGVVDANKWLEHQISSGEVAAPMWNRFSQDMGAR